MSLVKHLMEYFLFTLLNLKALWIYLSMSFTFYLTLFVHIGQKNQKYLLYTGISFQLSTSLFTESINSEEDLTSNAVDVPEHQAIFHCEVTEASSKATY